MTIRALMKDPVNLIVSGVGGQGNVMISLIIGEALVRKGYMVTIGDTYGLSQRGGSVMSHVRVSQHTRYSSVIPHGQADIILGMEPVETLRMIGQYGNTHVICIVNPRPVYSIDVNSGVAKYPDLHKLMETIKALSATIRTINATEEAQRMGSPMFANAILIGALVEARVLPLDNESVEPVLRETFAKETEANVKAFRKGVELVRLETRP